MNGPTVQSNTNILKMNFKDNYIKHNFFISPLTYNLEMIDKKED